MSPATLEAIKGLSDAQALVVEAIDYQHGLTLESVAVDPEGVATVQATVDLTGQTLTWRINDRGEPEATRPGQPS